MKKKSKGSVTRKADGRVDLGSLTKELRTRMRTRAPVDYTRGKDRMQRAVQDVLGCTEIRAEHIVDSLVARGYAHFGRHPQFPRQRTQGRWELNPKP